MGSKPELGEEMGVAGGDQGVDGEEAGGPVVGVEPVPPPGVVAQEHVGSHVSDEAGELPPFARTVLELAVDPAEEGAPWSARPDACRPHRRRTGPRRRPR